MFVVGLMNSIGNYPEAINGLASCVVCQTVKPDEVLKWWQVMKRDGQPVEIRLLQKSTELTPNGQQFESRATYTGIFTNGEQIVQALQSCTLAGVVYGVYFTLNAIDEAAARRKSWGVLQKAARGGTVSDDEIKHRDWLLVDFDAERPSGISATDAEKDLALEVAQNVLDFFSQNDYTLPTIISDSGNGFHFLWRLDMANTPEDTQAVVNFLYALGAKFGTDAVKIDTSVSNASRICKLYGTLAAKGPDTPDRPHRLAKILKVVEGQEPLTRDGLESLTIALGGKAVEDSTQAAKTEESHENGQETRTPATLQHKERTKGRNSLKKTLKDVESVLHQMERAGLHFNKDYHKWDAIFFGFAHSLGEEGRGLALRFSALCEGNDPQEDSRKFTEHIAAHVEDESTIASFFDLAAGFDIFPRVCWWDFIHRVEDALPDPKPLIKRSGEIILGRENLCVVAGKPKTGKTHLLLGILSAALNGGSALGFEADEPLNIILADTEQSVYHLDAEVKKILRLAELPNKTTPHLTPLHLRALAPKERMKAIEAAADELRPDIIFIDGAGDLVNNINDIEESEAAVESLLRLTSRLDAGIVAVIHTSWSKEGKLTGHLGSILERKAQTVVLLKREEGSDQVTVKAPAMRDGNFKPFDFRFIEGGEMEIVGPQPKETPAALQLLAGLMTSGVTYSHADLKRLLANAGKTETAAKKIISRAVESGIIAKSEEGYTASTGDLPI